MRDKQFRAVRAAAMIAVWVALGAVTSCGPVYDGLAGISRMMPKDTLVRCPFCKKDISERDRKCPFCGRDVQFDLGTDAVDKEAQNLTVPPRKVPGTE